MTEHEHKFPQAKPRHVVWCETKTCDEVRVISKRGKPRELTPQEQISLIAIMIEDVALAQAMIIIHGKERGMQRTQEILGYSLRGG